MSESEAMLRERFEVVEETFIHRRVVLNLLRPRDVDGLINEDDFAKDEKLPYWAELWPAAKGLARWVLDGGGAASRLLEVGCGIGLPALAAAARGMDVTASDYDEDALRFVSVNAQRNGLTSVGTRLLDWRALPEDLGAFDDVLAADVLYEERHARDLAAALPRLVREGGRAIIADPGRKYRGVLVNAMREQGWSVREVAKVEEPAAKGTISVVTLIELRPLGP